MKKRILFIIFLYLTSCVSTQKSSEGGEEADFEDESESSSEVTEFEDETGESSGESIEELEEEFADSSDASGDDIAQADKADDSSDEFFENQDQQVEEQNAALDEESLSLDEEAKEEQIAAGDQPEEELSLDDEASAQVADENKPDLPPQDENQIPEATAQIAEEPQPEQPETSASVGEEIAEKPLEGDNLVPAQVEPLIEPEPVVAAKPSVPVLIKNIEYEHNDIGGTVLISLDRPAQYTTRLNQETNQFVIEIPGGKLPATLARPFDTRDFNGAVGSINAYQDRGSGATVVVVQLREGVTEPMVQAEGKALVVVTQKPQDMDNAVINGLAEAGNGADAGGQLSGQDAGIMSSSNLIEFLSGNMKFSGKKISIESDELNIRDAIKLIADESGANFILDKDVNGEVSLKLRQVPWDQALVMILKTANLGYIRHGNIMRIAKMETLTKEEDDLIKVTAENRKIEPLKVQMIPISYAKLPDMVESLTKFKSERGGVVKDDRTNTVIITDTQDHIDRMMQVVASLDVAPSQVLIEGKVVEARETFERQVGIRWGFSGAAIQMGSGAAGNVNLTPSLSVSPSLPVAPPLTAGINIGTLDIFGNLDLVLAMQEREDNVKVISSPRIVALHNEKANMKQATQVPFIVNRLNEDGSVTRGVEFKSVDLNLDVVPMVTNDNSVLLDVKVKRSFLGPVVDAETQAAPINEREAQTKVLVKNGQTAVIGGVYQNDNAGNESGVPGLKNIPVIGFLFKSKTARKDKTELLIFLTPRILTVNKGNVKGMNLGAANPAEGGASSASVPTSNDNLSPAIVPSFAGSEVGAPLRGPASASSKISGENDGGMDSSVFPNESNQGDAIIE